MALIVVLLANLLKIPLLPLRATPYRRDRHESGRVLRATESRDVAGAGYRDLCDPVVKPETVMLRPDGVVKVLGGIVPTRRLLAYTNIKTLYTPTMPSKPVQISLETELLERIDADEETRTHGRSAFMRSAAERYLRARQRAQIDARIRAAYAGVADAMRQEIDHLMHAQAWPED
jgi:hypothetical protein